jgi:hypothetical protein
MVLAMMITGPLVHKTVHVPAHDEQVLDPDAYWNLDYQGNPAPVEEPMLWYAKVAFPSLTSAQHQFRTERLALEAERAAARRRTRSTRPRRRRQAGK